MQGRQLVGVVVGQTLASDQPSEGEQARVVKPPRTARLRSCGVIRKMVSLDRDNEDFLNFFIVLPSSEQPDHSGWAANGSTAFRISRSPGPEDGRLDQAQEDAINRGDLYQ